MPKSTGEKKASTRFAMSAVALELAASQSVDEKSSTVSVLMFEVGGSAYAVGAESTEGVVDCPRITPLPSPPEGVAGLTSVRGRMTVVMDLGESRPEQVGRFLILVKGDAQLALLADRVEGVVVLEPKKVRPVAHGKNTDRAKLRWPAKNYFKSGTRRVPIIDVERLCES